MNFKESSNGGIWMLVGLVLILAAPMIVDHFFSISSAASAASVVADNSK